jgi:thiol-disulfide isomerase/thioredoxin
MILPLSNADRAGRQQFQQLRPVPEAQYVPSFNLLLSDGVTTFSTGAIPPGHPVVLVLFSPECPYCRVEIESIIRQIRTLTNIRFYFITPCAVDEVQEFSREYRLDSYPNIVVGIDRQNFLLRFSRTKVIPYTAIYDADKRLKEAVFGQTNDRKIKEILSYR